MKIDLSDAPQDAIELLVWLSGARNAFDAQIEPMWQRAYFDARFTGRLDEAENLRLHSHKKIMEYTRAENERRGRMIRWGDRRG
jgi:hypothetical protein